MKALRALIGMIMGLSCVGSVALLVLADPRWKWGSVIIMLCFTVATLGKAFHLRMNTLRGKFHLILGTGGLVFSAAMIVSLVSITPWQIFGTHYLARFIFIVSVALMFIGLMKQGYTLSVGDWIIVLVVFAALAATGLWFFHTLYAGATVLMTILIYMSLFLMLETMSVVQVYLGSNLGWRWTAGAVSVLCVTLGDMSMAYGAVSGLAVWEAVQYLSWSGLGVIMCIISLMWD